MYSSYSRITYTTIKSVNNHAKAAFAEFNHTAEDAWTPPVVLQGEIMKSQTNLESDLAWIFRYARHGTKAIIKSTNRIQL